MAQKRSIKDAATSGAAIFDTIIRQPATADENQPAAAPKKTAKNVQDVPAVPAAPAAQDAPVLMERLNLKIPADIKAYLYAAAYRESSPTKTVSLTEYLCELVRADMEKHKE